MKILVRLPFKTDRCHSRLKVGLRASRLENEIQIDGLVETARINGGAASTTEHGSKPGL